MKIEQLTVLKRKFPHADIVIKQDGQEISDFTMEFQYTSEGSWKIVIIPRSPKN